MTNDPLPEDWGTPQFNADELAIITEAVAALPAMRYSPTVLHNLKVKCASLAFMEVSRNA